MEKRNKFINFIDNFEGYFVIYAIGVMGIVLLLQVFARYIFNRPLVWSEAVARYLFVWICFIGAGYGVKNHLHIEMELIFKLFPKSGQVIIQVVENLFAIAMFAYILPGAFQYTAQQAMIESPVLPIPMSLVVVSIPIGLILVILRLIIDTVNIIRRRDVKKTEGADVA